MTKKPLNLILFLTTAPVLANGNVPPQFPTPPTSNASNWSYYAGFGAGFDNLRGKRHFDRILPSLSNRTSKTHLSDTSGRFEGYLGTSWVIPNTKIGLGIEPFGSYSNVKDSDFNNRVIAVFFDIPLNDGIMTTLRSKYSFGINLRPSYNFDEKHSLYALVGGEVRHINFRFQDSLGSTNHTKHYSCFNWGVGYEYRFDASNSAIGLRFRHTIMNSKNINFNFQDSSYRAKIKPSIYSGMITYKYYLKG